MVRAQADRRHCSRDDQGWGLDMETQDHNDVYADQSVRLRMQRVEQAVRAHLRALGPPRPRFILERPAGTRYRQARELGEVR